MASNQGVQNRRLGVARATLKLAAGKFGAIANNRRPDAERLKAAEAELEAAADAFVAAKHEAAALEAASEELRQ